MTEQDLDIAKTRLFENDLALVIVKDKEAIYETDEHGISGFLAAAEKLGCRLCGASVADKVVGRAVALLCVGSGVRAVFASVLSMGAREIFEQKGIHCEWVEIVDRILRADKKDVCPFEKLAAEISEPGEAYVRLRAFQDSLRKRTGGSR
jgi:hypothetical protein